MLSELFFAIKRFFKVANDSPIATPKTEPPFIEIEPEKPLPNYPQITLHNLQSAIYSVDLEVIFTKATYSCMRENSCVSNAFVEVYQCLSEGVKILYMDSETKWDEYDLPTSRTEEYGTKEQGLFMHAVPKTSGHGAHGESGYWTFTGLPPHIKITGEHHVDYRMPTSRLKLIAKGLYECQGHWLIQNFALELREAIGGEWNFNEGTWSQPVTQLPS
jgi:hypothetical protein